jgi:hypothetical protein
VIVGRYGTAIMSAVIGLVPAFGLFAAPSSSLAAIVLGAIAIVGALHGLGRVVGRVAGDDDAPVALVLAWGLAAWIGIAGVLIAADGFGPIGRTALAGAGCGAGAVWAAIHLPRRLESARVRGLSPALAIALAAVAGVMVLYVLGAAARWQAPFLDVETGYLGQLARLDDTGGLRDAVGFPRTAGLGGHIASASLGGLLGDLRAAHVVDRGIAFAIALGLLVSTGRRAHAGAFAVLAIPLLASVVPELPGDMAPSWSIVALVLATWATLARADERDAPQLALVAVGVAAALATLRHPGVVFAVAIGIAAVRAWPDVRGLRSRLIALAVAIVAPYAFAALAAWRAGPSDAELVGASAPALTRAIAWIAAGGLIGVIVRAATPERARAMGSTVVATIAALGACGALAPTTAAAVEAALPFAAALALVLAVMSLGDPAELGDGDGEPAPRPRAALTVCFAAVVCAAVTLGRYRAAADAIPTTWPNRLGALAADAHAVAGTPRSSATREAAQYAAAQAAIPDDARVGIWTDRPDLVRYDRQAVVDLRTGPARRCVAWIASATTTTARPPPACTAVVDGVHRLGLTHLLVAESAVPRADVWRARLPCRRDGVACRHPLAALLEGDHGQVHAHDGGLVVIELAPR